MLGLVSLYLVAIITMFYYELEYLSLVFISVFIGGVAILFLFVILAVDIRKENKGSIFREDAALLYSTLVTFTLSACLLLYYMSDNYSFLLAKYPKNYFVNSVSSLDLNEISYLAFSLFVKNYEVVAVIGLMLFLATIAAMILSVNIFESSSFSKAEKTIHHLRSESMFLIKLKNWKF